MKFLHNISRIEAFSDAVFAFAATLMVVSLEAVDGFSVLHISFTAFIGFAISFFVLIMLWKMHYNFFRRTNYIDNWIIAFNSVLLFVVLYYVFPLKSMIGSLTNLFFRNGGGMTKNELVQLFLLYGVGFFLIFLCISLMYYRAYKRSKEIDNALTLLFYTRHFAIFCGVAVLSILLSVSEFGLIIGAPGFIYSLIGLFCYLHAKQFNKKHNTLI
ncbi:putative membrane protein [Saonia flava]|uniref:Putative membrane protein n=1 Tax=Saonia flava TaxID=523696 RepID=A0A846QVQ8_9FLAO|nr:TMEM175 family protein [Saonia flava]NJB72078.1 putative membrane protein [Saonia flava]